MTGRRLTYAEHYAFFLQQQRYRRRKQFELDHRFGEVTDIKLKVPSAPSSEPPPPTSTPAPGREPTVRIPQPPKVDRTVRLVLRVKAGPNAGREFVLMDGTYTIGRGQESDFVLFDDTVSERHAEVVVTENRTTIEDLGSTNGTRRDDTVLLGVARLNPGDRLFLGETELVVESPRT